MPPTFGEANFQVKIFASIHIGSMYIDVVCLSILPVSAVVCIAPPSGYGTDLNAKMAATRTTHTASVIRTIDIGSGSYEHRFPSKPQGG